MNDENTNWGQSVAGVTIRDNAVLLARHTYGNGKGMLIIPGGYVNVGESPQDALRREFREETNIVVEPKEIIGIRFNIHDWYIVFVAEYVSGEATSDQDENSEVVWIGTGIGKGRCAGSDQENDRKCCFKIRRAAVYKLCRQSKTSAVLPLYGI